MKRKIAIFFLLLMSGIILIGCKKNKVEDYKQENTETTAVIETSESVAESDLNTELSTDEIGNTISVLENGQTVINNGLQNNSVAQNNVVNNQNNTAQKTIQATTTSKPVSNTCSISISVSQIKSNINKLPPNKHKLVPNSGMLMSKTTVSFSSGQSVYDILLKTTRDKGIHLDSQYTAMYGSAYIKGIGNIYEFDCGSNSGWLYSVNGSTPSYGCSKYQVKPGDNIVFYYKCG